jgi:hypothetical protein
MANSIFRVGGGGNYTVFTYNGKQIAYAQMVQETGPQPVAQPQPIQPLDSSYPIEIAMPAALAAGMLEITFLETWNQEVWAQLGGEFTTAADLLDVFKAQLAQGAITMTKVITNPSGQGVRTITYHGCVVVNVQVDELIQIGTMTLPKTVTIMYLQRTEQFFNS